MENINKLEDKIDNITVTGIRNMIQSKNKIYEIHSGRVREYCSRLLGGEETELGVRHVQGIPTNVTVEELQGKIMREEICF
jgi:hypothetical protein